MSIRLNPNPVSHLLRRLSQNATSLLVSLALKQNGKKPRHTGDNSFSHFTVIGRQHCK